MQSWQHYASVRNLNGPHEGLPHVQAVIVGKTAPKVLVTALKRGDLQGLVKSPA